MASIWRGRASYDDFPPHMVPCPLEGEAINGYYMVDVDAHPTYKQQEDAIKEVMLNPPTTLTFLSTMTSKAKKQKLSPYEVSGGEEWGRGRRE